MAWRGSQNIILDPYWHEKKKKKQAKTEKNMVRLTMFYERSIKLSEGCGGSKWARCFVGARVLNFGEVCGGGLRQCSTWCSYIQIFIVAVSSVDV